MKRTIYQKILNWKHARRRRPLILQGVRQCGKTHTLQAFGQHEFPRTHYFNFEKQADLHHQFKGNLNPSEIINRLSFLADSDINCQQDFIIFDEIQACPEALTSLKYFAEEMPELALGCAGSLLGVTLNHHSFPVGKVNHLQMHPLSFFEFLRAINDERALTYLNDLTLSGNLPDIVHQHLWEKLKIYFIVGGLPEAIKIFREYQDDLYIALQKVREKQHDLIKDYHADIAKHSGKVNAMHMHRVWDAIPDQLARTQDSYSSRFIFKDILPSASRYSTLAGSIDWLEAAGLVIKVPIINQAQLPLSAYAKENIFKLYLFDVGILGATSNLSPATIMKYDYGTYKGYFAENFVAQVFLYQGVEKLFCWEGKTAEIEFVRDIEGDIIPIEVKSGNVTKSKSLYVFTEKYHSTYQTVMSARNFYIDSQKKRHYYPLYLAERFPL